MAFSTIHTKYGLTAMSRAESTGAPINLTHMAVGDGNGSPVKPHWEQTGLARERYRGTINRVFQDPDDPTRFTAELVVPESEGGWTMRELGVFDAAGSLFAVGNLPEVYKPLPEEGSFGDAVLRLAFVVTNAAVVTVMVDPNVAVASQAWVINNMTAATIIPGGTVGQLLGKASNSDGDYEWQSLDAISVTVDTVAEKQLLAAGQTVVDLTVTTTYGLAVYVDGLRLDMGSGAGEWQPHATIATRLTLGQSYPANTRITLVNNEPAGSAPAPLERDKNLSDVPNKGAARSALDVYSKAEAEAIVPPGAVMYFARNTAPPGWLKCNGAAISRTAYSKLFAAIGTAFGAGDGFTTFNLPDLRGEFVRGWDDGRGVDGGRAFGSFQAGMIQSHSHTGSSESAGAHNHTGSANSGGSHNHSASSGESGSHAHSGTTASGGAHNHSASTGESGSHAHSGTTSNAGSHTHTIYRGRANANTSTGGNGFDNPVFDGQSGAAGDHSHSFSTNTVGNHTHTVSVGTGGEHTHSLSINSDGAHTHAIAIDANGGAETRPRNIALLACIRF